MKQRNKDKKKRTASNDAPANHEAYVEMMKDINPDIIPISRYSGPDGEMTFYCGRCESTFTRPASYFLGGKHTKCPLCNKRKHSLREIIDKIHRQKPNIEVPDKINSTTDKVEARCNIDGQIWHPLVTNLLKGQG